MDWPVEPEGLYATLTGLASRFAGLPPIFITENGCAYPDEVGVPDDGRIAFIRDHLEAAARAARDGVDLRGYFYWSLIDNFEWRAGTVRGSGWSTSTTPRRSARRRRATTGCARAHPPLTLAS